MRWFGRTRDCRASSPLAALGAQRASCAQLGAGDARGWSPFRRKMERRPSTREARGWDLLLRAHQDMPPGR